MAFESKKRTETRRTKLEGQNILSRITPQGNHTLTHYALED